MEVIVGGFRLWTDQWGGSFVRFYRPGLNIVADRSVKWTISFSGGLTRLRSYLLRSSSQPSGKAPSIPTFLQSCTCVRHRSIRLVAGHFFHHILGMRCVTHVHKHSHLKFILLLQEALLFRIYTSGQLWHHLFIFHDQLATTGFAAVCVCVCLCVLWNDLWMYSRFLLWRLMVEDYFDTCQHIYRSR